MWITLVIGVFCGVFYFDEIKAATRMALESGGTQLARYKASAGRHQASSDQQTADSQDSNFGRTVHLRARRGGHFFARAWINGRPINVMVDTGATGVALTYNDAETVGLYMKRTDFTRRSRTANGIAKSAPVTLDRIRIGDVEVDDVRASVSQPGRLHITLLGMTFLRQLSRVEIRGDELVLTQ